MAEKEIPIVYMCAGISSRFAGRIKQFAKIGPNGETLIEYSLNQALSAGFSKIIFIVGNLTEKPFRDFFGDNYKGIPVYYALQKYDPAERDRPWGSAEALCTLKGIINRSFVICNGDDIYGEKNFKILYKHLQKSKEGVAIGYKLEESLPEKGQANRGIFEVGGLGEAKGIKETFGIEKYKLHEKGLTPNSLCSMNIFALPLETIDYLSEEFTRFKKEHEGDRKIEFLLPNEISALVKAGKLLVKIYPNKEKWIGITYPEDEEIVKEYLKDKHA